MIQSKPCSRCLKVNIVEQLGLSTSKNVQELYSEHKIHLATILLLHTLPPRKYPIVLSSEPRNMFSPVTVHTLPLPTWASSWCYVSLSTSILELLQQRFTQRIRIYRIGTHCSSSSGISRTLLCRFPVRFPLLSSGRRGCTAGWRSDWRCI